MISTNANRFSHGLGTRKRILFFLQETFSTPDVFDSWKFQWPGDMYYSHGSNHSKGVLVLIRETLQFELKSVRKDSRGRFVIVEALVQDSPVLLINIYAPNKSNEAIDFYENLRTALLESKLPTFYKECLEAWSDFNGNHDIIATKQDVLNEIIWNNQNLVINKQSIYSKKIKEARFLKLGDIVANGFKLKRWDAFREKNLLCQTISSYKGFFPPFRLTGNCHLKMERIVTTKLTKLSQTMMFKM